MKNRKTHRRFYSVLLVLVCVLGSFTTKVDAISLDSSLNISEFTILKDDGTLASETNGIQHNKGVGLSLSWEVSAPQGTTLQNGDTLTFSVGLTNPSDAMLNVNSSGTVQNLLDENNIIIGTWSLNGRQINMEFNENVSGSTRMSGSIRIERFATVSNFTTQLVDVTVGNNTKQILFVKPDLLPLTGSYVNKSGGTGANQITWLSVINNYGMKALGDSLGQSYSALNNVIWEDTLIQDAELVSIAFSAAIPLTVQDGDPNNGSFSNTSLHYFPIPTGTDSTSLIKRITQNPGESYESFKARLNPLEYGVYISETGVSTIVANLGNMGNNGLYLSQFTGGVPIGDYLLQRFPDRINEVQRDIYNKTLGSDNVIQGQVPRIVIQPRVKYPNYASTSVQKQNTATLSATDANGNVITRSVSGNGTTTTPASSINILGNAVKLIKSDKNTSRLLEGASFKLQYKQTDGTWIDYTPTSGPSVLTTDAMGEVLFESIPNGTYRFVEVQAASGYDINSVIYSSQEVVVNDSDATGNVVYATNELIYRGDVQIIKVDGLYGGSLQGATFNVLDSNDAIIRSNLTTDANGSIRVTGLLEGSYKLVEVSAPTGYQLTGQRYSFEIIKGQTNPQIITITNASITSDVVVTKIWDDANNQDGIRPESISLSLYADGIAITQSPTLVKNGNTWTYTYSNLPMYANGHLISYTVSEDPVSNYDVHYDGLTITNTHKVAVKDITGTKTWLDADNQDGIRPDTITLNLYANGNKLEINPLWVKNNNTWTYTYKDLPVYENGSMIEYALSEEPVEGYTVSYNGFDITNTHTVALTNIQGTKTWVDDNNTSGKRPDAITLHLYADGETVTTLPTWTKSGDVWYYVYKDLPLYNQGKVVRYTVTEDAVEGYDATYDGLDITNTLKEGDLDEVPQTPSTPSTPNTPQTPPTPSTPNVPSQPENSQVKPNTPPRLPNTGISEQYAAYPFLILGIAMLIGSNRKRKYLG